MCKVINVKRNQVAAKISRPISQKLQIVTSEDQKKGL